MFSVTVTSWHHGGSGKTDSLSGPACLLADLPTSQAASRFAWLPLKTPTKLTYFNTAFQFYELTIFQQTPVWSGDFQTALWCHTITAINVFFNGIPRHCSVERHRQKEQNKGQCPLLLDGTYAVCERYLQAPKQMTCGSLGVRGKRDKEFWKDGEHTHKLEESRKMNFFAASQDTMYRCKGTWYCFLQHNKRSFQSTEFRHPA